MSEGNQPDGDHIEGRIGSVSGGMIGIGKNITQIRAEAGSTAIVGVRDTRVEARRVRAPLAARHTLHGMDKELGKALSALRRHGRVLMHGMGGMGKTALALKTAAALHAEKALA